MHDNIFLDKFAKKKLKRDTLLKSTLVKIVVSLSSDEQIGTITHDGNIWE